MNLNLQTLPSDVEAEKNFLQSLIIQPKLLNNYITILKPEDFYRESHQNIYSSMIELFRKDKPIDMVSLRENLESRGLLNAVGGVEYIMTLYDGNAIPTSTDHYVEIIRKKALRRRFIKSATEISQMGYDLSLDIKDVVDKSEQKIFNITQENIDRGLVSIEKIIDEKINPLVERIQQGEIITGVPTAYTKIDEMTSGFHKSDLIILAARPSMGKTALAINMALRVSGALDTVIENPAKVAIFSLEMPSEQLILRMLARMCRINLHLLRTGKIGEQALALITVQQARLKDAPIYIDDSPELNIISLRAKLRRAMNESEGLDLVIVDYMQLMSPVQKHMSTVQEVTEISKGLKQIAREFDVPVIALSQLSRAPEQRRGKDQRPKLSDLRDSGSIEQDADIVMFIYRQEFYEPENIDVRGIADILISKQRNGPTGTVQLSFVKDYASFENLASFDEDEYHGEEQFGETEPEE